ncbi:MAG TPA: cytochrome c biogenesis protein CcsA, partial [Chitinophagales bacterium]|nr:cytochrome c biogenesis protein CcsA [Chitinophagales bacterium]
MTNFEGELLWPGVLGQLSVLTAFTTAIFCSIAYFIATRKQATIDEHKSWIKTGRVFFTTQAVATFLIGAALFYIIANHRFEYRYAWEHSSMALPMQYLLSCFWEGQEGSFLLWMFWNAVLGVIVMSRAGKHEPYVMVVFGAVQAFIGSMLLGIYIGDYKIGAAPFILLRDSMEAPIFQRADYLSFIKDGNGLNPLLQNYWMVIHPPTLFLGFAATLVPFAYAVSALWQREYQSWIKPVLPWALFGGAVLGTGIMMGGAWAYESLTFGGYWAWDPVENASLVPWLILIAGIHTLLAFKKTGHSLRITMVFFLLSFILVLYSTFLTRSGILGDSSVHAFTDLGMSGQLVFYLAALTIPALVLLIVRWKSMPSPQREEELYTREFWMFIGSLMLLLSSLHIILWTSIPVWDTIGIPKLLNLISDKFEGKWAPPTDPVQHYNRWQIPFAIIIAILSTASLFLKFKKTDVKYFATRLGITALVALLVTVFAAWAGEIFEPVYVVLLFAGIYSIVANLYYLIVVLSGKVRISGPALAHMGFGLMLVGILFSSYNQETISRNTLGIDFGEGFDDQAKRENMLLYKNIPSQLGPYTVTYVGDSVAPPNHYYKVVYERFDSAENKVVERFMLKPNAQINPKMG